MDEERLPRHWIVAVGVGIEGSLALIAWGLGWLVGQRPGRDVRWDWRSIALGALATGPLLLLFMWSLRSTRRPLVRIRAFFDVVVRPLLGPCTIIDLALISIAAGVGEELLFRGVIQGAAMRSMGLAPGIAVASVLFGLAHPITPAYTVLAAVMGAYLGLLWVATDNLLAAIVTHALYDFMALVYLLHGRASSPVEPS
jgi:uncharacterized protein